MKATHSTALICLPLLLLSCNSAPSGSQLDSSSVSGGISTRLELGQAYDVDQAKWGNLACVQGVVISENLGSSGELEYRRDMSYEETLKEISGELEVGVTFPSVAIEGKADYAASNSSSEFREMHTLTYKYRTRSKFQTGSHQMTEQGVKFSKEQPWKLRDRCKDEFVNEIIYGGSYIANMSVEFKNKEDKEKFGGSLSIDALQGKVTVKGKLALANEEEKRSVKIRLNASQEGGDPRLLSKVLTPDVASCDAANLEKCLEGFRALIAYGQTFTDQILSTNNLVVLSYNTESYADTGLDALVADEADETDEEVLETRFDIEVALERVRQQIKRAEFVSSNYAAKLTEEQSNAMPIAKLNLRKNKALLTKALEFCYKNPYAVDDSNGRGSIPCTDNYEITLSKLEAIPESVFSIPGPISAAVLKNVIRANSCTFATLDDVSSSEPFATCQTNSLPLPNGWILAPNDATSKAVIAENNWGTDVVVLSDGTGIRTKTFQPAGDTWTIDGSSLLVNADNKYQPVACNLRVLIRSGC